MLWYICMTWEGTKDVIQPICAKTVKLILPQRFWFQVCRTTLHGDVVGFVKYLSSQPVDYLGYVPCVDISSMDRNEELQDDMEGAGVEKNLRNRGENFEGGKGSFHQS